MSEKREAAAEGQSDPESRRPRGRDELVFRKVGDEWLLFDPRAQDVHVLNLSAALVWSHCTGEFTVEGIVRSVADSYEETSPEDARAPEEMEPRVREILARFDEADLLVEE